MKHEAIPFHQWPAIDQSAWNIAIANGDWFDGQGPAAHWTPASQNSIRTNYGRWLGFIKCNYINQYDQPLLERLTPDTIEHYINALGNTVSNTTLFIYIDHLLCALQVMAPDHDLTWLKRMARQLQRDVTPKSKRHKMVDSQRLFALGVSLMNEAEEKSDSNKLVDAILYRDGLLISLLAARPLRRRTLSLIRIGKHFHHIGNHYILAFAAGDTKNKQAIDFELPGLLTPYLDRYLNYYRGHFPNAINHDGLWPSVKGCPLLSDGLYKRIITRTRTAFGFSINPHLFRDCAATTLATYKPDQVLTGAGLLGHSNLNTIHQHYIHAQTIQAGKNHQVNLIRIRKDLDVRGNRTP